MSRKSATTQPLHEKLLSGFTYTRRPYGSVYTVKVEKKAVAEVCVGKKTIRLNVRAEGDVPKGLKLSGKSKSWPQGGCIVTDETLASCRAWLASLASAKPATPKALAPRKTTKPKTPASRTSAAAAM